MTPFENGTISLTGNPFVDTGLAVLAALVPLDQVEALTIEDIRRVHGDGSQLSSWNGKLKNFTMVFTKNSLLTNASIKDPSKRTNMYQRVVNGLLNRIGLEELPYYCEACGAPQTLDFDRLCRSSLEDITANEQARFVGRDWFPLTGSMGSDAQALPAASRPVRLCAKCLFAVHYLPLGLILLDGQLTVFQSTSIEFWYEIVRDIANKVQSRIRAGDYSNLGAKEGTRAIVRRLLEIFDCIQTAKRFSEIPQATALEAWRFTNSNPPSCDITEIPNPALRFLWDAVSFGLRQEIEEIIGREGKRERPFLHCVLELRDYRSLYPRGKWKGASPKLFALYQTRICGRTAKALALAHILANERAKEFKPKEFERLKREEAFSDASVRTPFRGMIARLVSEGEFTLEDYLGLFPLNEDAPGIRVDFAGWNLIRYYLHHLDEFESPLCPPLQPSQTSSKLAAVRYYAVQLMRDYVEERGKDRFRLDILNRIARGDIGAAWLRRQFVRLAECNVGFNYEAWNRLSVNDGGQVFVKEMLFQMRLLWSQWAGEGDTPQSTVPELPNGSGLPSEVVEMLQYIFSQYVDRRGLKRFQADVLTRIRREEIGLGWFRRQLTAEGEAASGRGVLTEDQWEGFLKDEEGRQCAGERLYQMHLFLANAYREAINLPEEVIK